MLLHRAFEVITYYVTTALSFQVLDKEISRVDMGCQITARVYRLIMLSAIHRGLHH